MIFEILRAVMSPHRSAKLKLNDYNDIIAETGTLVNIIIKIQELRRYMVAIDLGALTALKVLHTAHAPSVGELTAFRHLRPEPDTGKIVRGVFPDLRSSKVFADPYKSAKLQDALVGI